MKTYAYHRQDGSITSLVTLNLPDSAGLQLRPKAGIYVTEIEEIKLKEGANELGELREIMETHRVAASPRVSILSKK